MIVGDARLWSGVFPEDLVPRIVDLVWETWLVFPMPAADELEVPITRRFKGYLKQAKDYRRLPLRIERECAEDDPHGSELGRIDLKFMPAESALEEVYFAFECKRLNVVKGRSRRTLAPEYVSEGMMRFVSGQYGTTMTHGGMIGYVLDGRCDDAIRLIGANITKRASTLLLSDGGGLVSSTLRPNIDSIRETLHNLPGPRLVRLHHLLLACSTAPTETQVLPHGVF
jgi:hypothetical protein